MKNGFIEIRYRLGKNNCESRGKVVETIKLQGERGAVCNSIGKVVKSIELQGEKRGQL